MFESPPGWAFIIDTDKYSGNFERQMCAFCTGQVGECGVGSVEAADFLKEFKNRSPFDNLVSSNTDDHGCSRPACIWPTPGRANDGTGSHYDIGDPRLKGIGCPAYESVAIFFYDRPTPKCVEIMKSRSAIYAEREKIGIRGFRIAQIRLEITHEPS